MKFTKEVRIGFLVTISLLIFFAGFYFLKGANLFSGENTYYVFYDNIQGLQTSSSVQIKGLSIGHVAKVKLRGTGKEKILVAIAVSKKVQLPQGSVAELISTDLIGTKAINLELATGSTYMQHGDTMQGIVKGGLLDNLSVEIAPLIADIRHVVGTLDTVVSGVNLMLGDDNRQRLSNSIAALEVTMANFAALAKQLNAQSGQLSSLISNANSITGNLADNNRQINNILRNADTISSQLSGAPIRQTFNDLQMTVTELNGILDKINKNQGSLGMMVHDKQLYQNLTEALKSLDVLMADLKEHPTRYINVTIFGRKKQQ
jgi:phospholipid/cholesterol/gamma-HCH transport system substrate-binding protein